MLRLVCVHVVYFQCLKMLFEICCLPFPLGEKVFMNLGGRLSSDLQRPSQPATKNHARNEGNTSITNRKHKFACQAKMSQVGPVLFSKVAQGLPL